jgi:hypothetical protein
VHRVDESSGTLCRRDERIIVFLIDHANHRPSRKVHVVIRPLQPYDSEVLSVLYYDGTGLYSRQLSDLTFLPESLSRFLPHHL